MNILWFRRDLRLADNRALAAAVKEGDVLPVYILDEGDEFAIGGASKWWLHQSLDKLNEAIGGNLQFFKGSAATLIPKLAKQAKAAAVFWNRCYEPAFIETDKKIEKALQDAEIKAESFQGSLLREPEALAKKDGSPYKIYSPYLKASLAADDPAKPIAVPRNLSFSTQKIKGSVTLDGLKLMPRIKWYEGMDANWEPGEAAAKKLLKDFVAKKLSHYSEERNYPSHDILSRLSPHLHYGELSPATVWYAVHGSGRPNADTKMFISELTWRDFAYSLLYHFPETATKSYNERLQKLRWHYNKKLLRKWQQGQTGFPIVDAGMRQLWQTGYMHNRVRMITASFLIKNMLMDWLTGAEWFMDCLVDADMAVNTMNWQWVAGTGLDAAPFFRVFNPVLQSKKYDADGAYIKTFVPEISNLPKRYLHEPWKAPEKVLKAAGIELGKQYPKPCLDLEQSAKDALAAYQETK